MATLTDTEMLTYLRATSAHRHLTTIFALGYDWTTDTATPAARLAETFAENLARCVIYPAAHKAADSNKVGHRETGCYCSHCVTERSVDDAAIVWRKVSDLRAV